MLKGATREWLKVFETLPPQLLNAYGEASFNKMGDEAVWDQMSAPLVSGAMYCTELASPKLERRGIGSNRWIDAELQFCRYQLTDTVRTQNQFVLKEKLYDELYKEIERIQPSLEYCLAPKKEYKKQGAASLRSGLRSQSEVSQKDPKELDKHSKVLWEWLDTSKPSVIRMLMNWQSGGGLPFVAACHRRGMQCFKYFGDKLHSAEDPRKTMSLAEFQEMVKYRQSENGVGQYVSELATQGDYASLGA